MNEVLFLVYVCWSFLLLGFFLTVQLVTYPNFLSVSRATLSNYEKDHRKRITPLVVGLFSIDLSLGLYLLFFDSFISIAVVLSFAVYGVSLLWFLPIHKSLETSPSPRLVRFLILRNWVRVCLVLIKCLFLIWLFLS